MVAHTFNELIEINNDRIAGYEKAITQTEDPTLEPLFSEMVEQSRQFIAELNELSIQYGIATDNRTTLKGKIYRTWMDLKATFGADDREGILKSCEFGEHAAQRAYESALEDDDLDNTLRDLINTQKNLLKTSEEKIVEMGMKI